MVRRRWRDRPGADLARWTRRDLGCEAHVDEGTLCDLFAGRRRPTLGTIRALGHVLELSLEDVIGFSEGPLG